SSNTSSNKLSALFDNIKQTLLGVGGSQAINYLVQGDEASSSGIQKGRGAISTPEITKLDGFALDEIEEVGSDLGDGLSGSVTNVETPELSSMENELNIEESSDQEQAPNLIVNGDFEQGGDGWESTHGVEASYSSSAYGVSGEGHGSRVTELDTYTNTSLSQDLTDLAEGEVIAVSFDFAKRAGISSNEGIEVLWNGDVVFSTSGDEAAWQQKTLKLTANSGSNRIEFKGTGHNDGLGYVLDNVVAKSETSHQANAVADNAEQNQAAKNAMSDKERAEADRQRLEQEKQKQLEAVSGSQAQLESTDQEALESNGQAQRDAVNEESEAVTKDLTAMAQGLDVLDNKAEYTGVSGDHWRDRFAGGLLKDVQTQLDNAKDVSGEQIADAKQAHQDNQKNVNDSVAKSEAGVAKGEDNRSSAEQDIADAKADADARKAETTTKTNEAKQAESNANNSARDAEERGNSDARNAENKANQAQADAKGSKQNESDRPDRQGASGSGLSNESHFTQSEETTSSDVDTINPQDADGRFSEGLTDQEQEALDGAVQAVNRLQINAGIRSKNTGSSVTSLFTKSNADSIVLPTTHSQDVARKEIRISGVNLQGLSGGQGNQATGQHSSKSVPGFQSHFSSTSIGIENELSGLVVVLPKNSAQTFGYVHDSQGNPLFMLTKDMNQGGYSNPARIADINGVNNWQTHTIELVTYPSETSDTTAIESRKEAMLWLAKEFTGHINQSNHQSLPQLVSDDGHFTLVISNSKHLIAAGNGTAIEAQGQTIGMTPSGQQATMGISAKEFGSSSSLEVRLLESAPWYQSGLRDEFLVNSNEHKLDDPTAAQNVYAYLTSVYSKTADLAKEYGIYINDWDPASEGFSPNAQGLTDPKVKNAWEILPRTKPVKMLELLSADDSRYVRQQIIGKLKGSYSESLAKSVFEYFQYGGEVAGHGINNATTGNVQQPEPAILFEFRSVPNVLSEFVPKTESTAKVDVKALDHFDFASRKVIIAEVNALVSGSDDFDTWYQEYRASKGQPPVKKPKSSASANHKAEWLMTQHADKWAKITAPYIESNETSTSTQAKVDTGEVLKGLQEDFKRYGDALKPDTSVPGKSKDIRTTKDFLNGYKNDHAQDSVDGFHSDMSIKQLVDLFVKGSWSAEQKGALAWEIESRALKVTFQNKSEKYNRLFREIASAGVVDAKATEQLAPQLMLMNLSNDGFGGRCDPLSKLVLVAKQLENDGQAGVARQLLEKMYSAAAVLSNPTFYSDSEKANASKLLSSLAAIHAKNPMHDTSIKVWQEKLEGKQALTVNGVVEKITDVSANGKPVLLELDAPGHAMAAWAKGSGDDRVYGFYDPNAGIVEFSSAEKFGAYLTRFFGKSDLNMAQSYKLGKNDAGEAIFNRVVVMDGDTLASYKPTIGDKTTMQGILDLPVFDATPISKPEVSDVLSGNEKHKENVAIENDGTPPRDKESVSPLTRFLNNELFGTKDARRKVGDVTETLLGFAVEKGESQKVTLKGEAGRLSGYFHKGAKASEGEESVGNGKVVLFLHGSGSSSEEQASAIRSHYHKQNIDMLAVNMRGYGESDGGPSEKGLYQDARTMFKYLVNDKGIDPSNIIIHGYSMGGPIAADLARFAAQNGQAVSGLLLDRPMPSMTKAITAHEVANPAGIVGALSKAVNGQFSVEKNLKGLPKDTPIMLLTDNEGLGGEGEKLRAKLAITGYNVTGEQTFYGHEASNRLMGQYADQIVSGLFNAEQAVVEAGEVLKGLEKDFKRYGDALKPDTSVPGKSKDIRTTKDFLNGYKNDHAKDIVDGFHSDMSIKQLVDLFVKGSWSAEQKGALAWEIESRALKVTFQNKSEKYNRLFREIASAGVVDAKATEQLAPQLMLLNLSNDGFGGRCDPLSKLVLVAKQLESDGQTGVARQLLEKMYSAAAVLSNPTLYSDSEKANASKLLSSLAAIHAKNPMHDTSMKVWQEKLEGKQALTVNGVVEKITDVSANGKPVLLELDAPGHAMAAWAKGSGEDRVYGFYDPNAGIVEFSSAEKFGAYLTRFFGKSDLNMAQSYKLGKNDAGEAIFNRVVVMDGDTLATYKPTLGDKTTMQGILDLPVFDTTLIKKPVGDVTSDLEALGNKTKISVDLSQVMTKDELKKDAQVFAKPIGESYQKILEQVELLHTSTGLKQIEVALNLNNLIDTYVAKHETSGRNSALKRFQEQLSERLYNNGSIGALRSDIADLAKTRPDLAATVISNILMATDDKTPKVDVKQLDDGTKYVSEESLNALIGQEEPFNKNRYNQELLDGRKAGEEVVANSNLNDAEIKGIQWYTSEGYQYVNESLRKNEKLQYFVKDNSVDAVKGMSKLDTFEGTVYRAFMPGVSLTELESRIAPGQLIGEKGFCSTSTSAELAKDFRGGKGTVMLTILDAKGTNVAGLAQLNQAEVLFKPGSHIRIEAIKKTDKNLHIVAKYTEDFRVGESVHSLFDGNKIGLAINKNTSTLHDGVKSSFDSADVADILTPKKVADELDLGDGLSRRNDDIHNKDVNSWERLVVSPQSDGGETRFEGQIIIQMENDSAVSKAAENLAGKHPDSTVVVQLDSDGNYRVIYGDPSKLPKDKLAGQLRWQLVGHGRDESENNNTHLSGYSADELAVKLAAFNKAFSEAESVKAKPDHISVVGCSLISDDKQNGFGRLLIQSMGDNDIRSDVSVRSSEVAVDSNGRKHTHDENGHWVQKEKSNKVTLSWDEQGEVTEKHERIRNGIAEGDIDLSRVGTSDVDDTARGAIADNSDVFNAPEKRKNETESSSSDNSSNKLSYSGNIQVNVGDGEFTAVNWGTSNVGIKVGTGGFKSLAFGDNNVMVHVGDGKSKHSFDIGGYQALEGAQMFIGNRNVSFNLGQSNDLIVMMDKSIPTPPLVNPFDGASRISGVLKSIASSGEGQDWLAAQEQQWTLSGAKKFVKDMSGLDQSSSVDYTSLVDLDSQNERSSRGLKNDAEATLNKQYNQWLGGSDNSDSSKMSRADKFRQANEKLAFNFAVGGQGADIQMTTGNWNFMFGDNIQSILDTNLGSLFGLMTQQFSTTGQAKTTFTYSPEDLPRQLKNKLLGQLAGVGADTTLGDIFGVDYTAAGHIVSRTGESVDGVAILKEMLEVVGEFSGDQLQAFVDPAKLLDNLESGVNMGADGIKTFAETHGLKEKAPEEEEDNSSASVNGTNVAGSQDNGDAITTDSSAKEDRAFGFNSLNLPNLFATIFSENKQTEMKSLVENLKENLTADLLNMKEKTFDFLRNSGHLQGDGDINVSLGNYNFNWGGDGKDLGAYLGDNNNFWGGRGDDVYYATGTSNIFTGGEGNDMGVLMGRENMMFGGEGNDTAVVAGRINHVFLGAGDDESFVFGEGGEIDTGTGRDYVVTSGNYNRVDTGGDQDYSVTIGNNNQVELGAGNDFANVFGNYNRINASDGNDVVKLMGYNAVLNGGEGDDHLIAAALSKFSQFNGGEGSDVMVLGGFQNTFKGGTGVDSFVVSGDVIDNLVEDIRSEDNIVFNGIDWQKLWLERSGYDLKLSILRDPESDTDQAKFEHIGSVTFNDYFNGNRAQVVVAMGDQGTSQDHTVLSNNAVDALVQAMSGFEPQVGDNGFIDNLDSKSRVAITTAWSDVSKGNSAIS
ncbi:MARTX multifunctional-autoprocessing repeats-in-toxin holotoxin RtxA, partial [Vibrio splendidus]